METEDDSRIPTITQYTHSLKIEDTSKGIRVTVHVYASDQKTAIEQAFGTYLQARERALEERVQLAPIEVNNNK